MADFTDKIPFNLGQGFGLLGSVLQMYGAQASYTAAKANGTIIEQQGILENEIAKANAQAIEMAGEADSLVAINNSIAKADRLAFENSLIKTNRQILIAKAELELENYKRGVRATTAEAKAINPHLSSDVIRSIELESFSKIASTNMDTNAQLLEMDLQMTENDRMRALEIKRGGIEALNITNASRNNAFYTRLSGKNAITSSKLRAGQTRIKGKADRLGSFTSAIASGVSYFS